MARNHILNVVTSKYVQPWANFLNENRAHNLKSLPDKLTVNLNNVYFIQPYHVVSLACLIEEYHMRGVEIKFRKLATGAGKYLKRLGFLRYWSTGFDRTAYHQSQLQTAFCLWKLKPEMISPYTVYAQQYYHDNFFSGKDLQPLNTALAEIFNNICDHSGSKVEGYVFTQYYPEKNEIMISVCDFGVGIPTKVNQYLKSQGEVQLRSEEAILKAFERGFSTKSTPSNRGFGLDTIFSLVKSFRSELLLISNNGVVRQQISGKFVTNTIECSFPGTQIVIKLNTKKLRALEVEEIADTDFSF